jgi:hypothetical protein
MLDSAGIVGSQCHFWRNEGSQTENVRVPTVVAFEQRLSVSKERAMLPVPN